MDPDLNQDDRTGPPAKRAAARPIGRRYPLDPLAAAAGIVLGVEGNPNDEDLLVGLALLAARLELPVDTVRTQRRRGLSDRQADHHACALGRHPVEIWPSWCHDATVDRWWCGCAAPLTVGRHCERCDGFLRPIVNPVAVDHGVWPHRSSATTNAPGSSPRSGPGGRATTLRASSGEVLRRSPGSPTLRASALIGKPRSTRPRPGERTMPLAASA